MDLVLACEGLVPKVMDQDDSLDVPESDVKRWQHLFGFSAAEAVQEIQGWHNNLGRQTITDHAWSVIKHDLEVLGHNKESYEYSLSTHRFKGSPCPHSQSSLQKTVTNVSSSNLVRLEGPISDLETQKNFAGLGHTPVLLHGTGDDDLEAKFCLVDGNAKLDILRKLSEIQSSFRPIFIRDSRARKELCPHSAYPTLGIDSTLPQFRPHSSSQPMFLPLQDQYPVWYFFYGTLADEAVLARVLRLKRPPIFREALVRSGRLTTWAGRYKALVDGPPQAVVDGFAYHINSSDEEDALRYYKTDKYFVVRCKIKFIDDKNPVKGLTFKFVG